MGGDEIRGLADRQDLYRLLVGNPDAVAVLELDDELDQVERVRLEVLPEAGVLADARGVHLQLGGQVLADAFEDLVSFHRLVWRLGVARPLRGRSDDATSGCGPQ